MKTWKLIVLMLCCSMIGVCGKYLYDYFAQSAENKNAYADIIDIGFSDSTDNQHVDGPESETKKEAESSDFDYDSLLAINSDCVGWIRVDGTDIDYPVVQAADNSFYLHRNFNQESAICGAIFMDYHNDIDLAREHLILYGHQMKDGSMFKQLKGYKDKDFYDKISKLTLQEQFIIKSIYFEGMKQKEVAEILGVTKGALSQRLGTILRKMRTMYLEG